MADIVRVKQIFDGRRYCEYEFTNESDGTGESSVEKIDLVDLLGSNGLLTGKNRPTSLSLIVATWEVFGFNYVLAKWERQPTDETIIVMSDSGEANYYSTGGLHDPKRGQDGTGNVLFTTDGGADGSAYRIRMLFKKKYT